jgi:hypothetical protein
MDNLGYYRDRHDEALANGCIEEAAAWWLLLENTIGHIIADIAEQRVIRASS